MAKSSLIIRVLWNFDSWLLRAKLFAIRRLLRGVWDRVFSGRKPAELNSTSAVNPRLVNKFCSAPFRQLDVYENGNAHQCCATWLPQPAGDLSKNSIDEVWNSDPAQRIRASILDGSFRYCKHDLCPLIQEDRLPTVEEASQDLSIKKIIDKKVTHLEELPAFVNLCNDPSCNLWCPSCRTERILHTDEQSLVPIRDLQSKVTQSLFSKPTTRNFAVNVTGSGDPFASRVFREFLFELSGEDFPNLQVNLQTNGVLLTPRNWSRLHRIHNNIKIILVSFDAATPETYAITRRGGHWDTLLENVNALGEKRRNGELNYLRLDFVVQQANYREMPDFVLLAESLGADDASFSMLVDWGTWPKPEYLVRAVHLSGHPEHQAFLDVLKHPNLGHPRVRLNNLARFRKLAIHEAQ